MKLVLERKDDVDSVQRVDLQLLKGAVERNRFGGNALRLRDDPNYLCRSDQSFRVVGHAIAS